MKLQLAHITLLVSDYDEAIEFYTRKLGFLLTEDSSLNKAKRWVLVTPPGSSCSVLLAKAANAKQKEAIGNQAGGRVFLFLHTDDFQRDYQQLLAQHIKIVREPRAETYGTVAVFEDLYGNRWDLIGPTQAPG